MFVGKIAAEKKEELEKLEKELQLLRNKIDGLKKGHDEKKQAFEKWRNEAVVPVRTDANLSGNVYNINKFKEDFTNALANEFSLALLTNDELTNFKNAVKEVNDRGVLNESTPDLKGINPEAITTSVNDILSCVLIPNQDDELQLIENDKEIFTWVETGVKIHQHRDKCLFCGEDYKTTRNKKLISFFQTKQAELIDKIDQFIRGIQDCKKR